MASDGRYKWPALVAIAGIFSVVLLAVVTGSGVSHSVSEHHEGEPSNNNNDDVGKLVAAIREFNPWADSYAQWLMMIFAAAATGVSLKAIYLLRDTLNANRESANAAIRASEIMHREQRPWLQMEERPTLTIGNYDGSLTLTAQADLKNVGKTPALGVELHIEISAGTFIAAPAKFVSEFAKSSRRGVSLDWTNRIIFPGEKQSISMDSREIPDAGKWMFVWIFVCVTYIGMDGDTIFHNGIAVKANRAAFNAPPNEGETFIIETELIPESRSIA